MKEGCTFKHYVRSYTKAVKENNAAPFANESLSIHTGFVNWKNRLRSIAAELNLDIDKENDLIAIALNYFHQAVDQIEFFIKETKYDF